MCETCGKVTATQAILRRHVRKVHEPKIRTQCTYCDKWYSTRALMLMHALNMHRTAGLEHRCDICGHVSSTRSALTQHKRFKHDLERKHKCSYCEKAFKTPTQLKVSSIVVVFQTNVRLFFLFSGYFQQHESTHTGIDLYKCAYCDMTFKFYSNRFTHIKRMHSLEYAKTEKRPKPKAISEYEAVVAHNKRRGGRVVNVDDEPPRPTAIIGYEIALKNEDEDYDDDDDDSQIESKAIIEYEIPLDEQDDAEFVDDDDMECQFETVEISRVYES